ncbi:hypothetical protein ONS95_006327 [Cadophora gregata]|uniref:uncharacterized protein n=1 Tax=Cadophora gregata TaxID=51156 RepID=UPI0026DACDFA|nr:uncharacterized protein ONS95_006327 [Cadophora gregata]KAK0102725.1 hypothetical protein ONS95_006327 [Cadophora gregata]
MARFTLLLSFLAAISPIMAHPTNGPRDTKFGCGVVPTEEFLAVAKDMADQEAASKSALGASALAAEGAAAAVITVNVYFHVVARSTVASGGYVTASQITQQLAVMNNNYAASGFQFVNAGTDWTINSIWASDGNELAMKKALRKGTYKDLNIYFQYDIGGNLGYCYFPTSAPAGSNNFYVSFLDLAQLLPK